MRHFTIEEVKPRVFFFKFKNHYKLAYSFMRFQELYESDLSSIQGKNFTIMQFMEAYSKKHGDGAFTYSNDWGGFNLPDYIMLDSLKLGHYNDFTEYDHEMLKAYRECKEIAGDDKFYIIGTAGGKTYLKHEVAHGLFYTNIAYREEMSELVSSLNSTDRKAFFNELKAMGYCAKVLVDETQAYLATGLTDELKDIVPNSIRRRCMKIFRKYYVGK